MIRHLRALAKAAAFTLVCGVMVPWLRLAGPLAGRLTGSEPRWRARVLRRWAALVLRILRVRVEVEGPPPSGPFFLVCNHLSYLDVVVLAARLHCAFVAKAEVARWPVFGGICRSVNTLFIDRTTRRDVPRVIDEIRRLMDEGLGVVVFPEGTSSPGVEVLGFKPALLEAAARAAVPVSHASLSYRVDPGAGSAQQDVCWWGDMEFPGHVMRLFRLRRIKASVCFGAEPIRHPDRKVLASTLHRAVVERFRPVPS